MRIWFDTEFIEDGCTIDLISIGMVREDGHELYLENSECDYSRASEWVMDNVIRHLVGFSASAGRSEIAERVRDFVGPEPEFWAYYGDYDWVALCQLYGTMLELPQGWPKFCRDVQQVRVERGVRDLPKQMDTEHHALNDALWTREAWRYLHEDVPAPAPRAETGADRG